MPRSVALSVTSFLITLTLGVVLAGCSSPAVVSVARQYGQPGQRFFVSFPKPPSEMTHVVGQYQAQYGTGVATRSIWVGGQVSVWVDSLSNTVPSRRIDPFLRSYLPNSTGGRITTMSGLPAAKETVPCSTPSGSCPSVVGSLVVLDGRTLYMVLASSLDSSTSAAVLKSFRL